MNPKSSTLFSMALLSIGLLFSSCDADDQDGLRTYKNGVIVINEGNFTEGDASISYINTDNGRSSYGLFSAANGRAPLGDVANSAYIHDGSLYVVVNNSNRLEVMNSRDFSSNYTVDLAQPRQFTVNEGIGYVTEWGVFPDPSQISVLNLETGSVMGTLPTGSGAEDMVFYNDELFVSNLFESTVSVIDLSTERISSTISTGSSPAEMITDANGKIWLICGGGFDFDTGAPLNNGQLLRIDPANKWVEATIELNTNVIAKLALDRDGQSFYFLNGLSVYKVSVTASSLPDAPFIEIDEAVSLYGIGVDPDNADVYITDSNGFQADGLVYRYSTGGALIGVYDAGRGPNGVLFN